jgi:hypothetical protein
MPVACSNGETKPVGTGLAHEPESRVMGSRPIVPILLERQREQLRQEREIFEQRKRQDANWFLLRQAMGYSAIVLLGLVAAVSSYVVLHAQAYHVGVSGTAGGALFVDVLGLIAAVWKLVLNPGSITQLSTVTEATFVEV